MRGLIKKIYRTMGFLGVSLSLASCQFGFMSAESEQAPIKQSLSFSSDPSLVASRITLSINKLANFRLTLCEEVELLVSNTNSQEVPVQSDTLFQLRSSNTQGIFYSDAACSNRITSKLVTKGKSRDFVYYKTSGFDYSTNATNNRDTLSVSYSTFLSQSVAANVVRVPTQLTFDTVPASLNVGVCSSGFTVTVRDGLGHAFVETSRSINLGLTGATGYFYLSSSNCTQDINKTSSNVNRISAVFLQNSSSATFYFKGLTSGTQASFSVSSIGVTNGTRSLAVDHTATQLIFDNAPLSLNVGVCSASFNLTSQDGWKDAFSENSKTITLDSASLGSFYSNSTDCANETNPITQVKVSNSSPLASLFFKTTNVGAGWIILTGSFSALSDASSTVTINHLVLDTSFNSSGQIVSSSLTGEYLAMAQYQGGYLVAGYVSVSGTARAYLARIDASGIVNSQFTENIGASVSSSRFNDIFVDGTDIYAAGYADVGGTSGKDFFVVKLNSSLAFNSDFNSQGWVTKDLNGNDSLIGISKNIANELVTVDDKFEVAFFNKDSGGFIASYQLASPPSSLLAERIAKDTSGNVVVAGMSNSKIAVMRFNPSNSAGVTLSNPTEFQSGQANSVMVDSSNRILLAGQSGTRLAVLRLTSGGLSLDSSFGSSGTLLDNAMSEAKALAVDSTGNLLIVGTASNQMAIRRYQSNGSMVNPSINTKTLSFAQGAAVANDILLDGFKILLSGVAGSNPAIARLFP